MRVLVLFLFGFVILPSFAQTVQVEEGMQSFRAGRLNAMTVNVPFVDEKTLEKALKNELKDWNGKYNSSKGEMTVVGAYQNAIGIKPFDATIKIIYGKNNDLSFALAIDLGGAYLNRQDHKMQYETMAEKMRLFALKLAKETINEENKDQTKILTDLEKDQTNLVKDKEDLEKSIADYEQKIQDAKKKIEQNLKDQDDKKLAIDKQKVVVEGIDKKLKSIK
ncbi:MAG: hypothetical protein WC044_00035 [Crocinitomicaceae bacterium]